MKYSVIFTAFSVAGLASAFVENPYDDALDLYSRDVYDGEFDAPFSLYERDLLDADYDDELNLLARDIEEPHGLYARALGRSNSFSGHSSAPAPRPPARSNSMPHAGTPGRHPTSEIASLYGGSSAGTSRRSSLASIGSVGGAAHNGADAHGNKPSLGSRLMSAAKAHQNYATDPQNRHDVIDKGSKLGGAFFQTAGQIIGGGAGGVGGAASIVSSGYGGGNLINAANAWGKAVQKHKTSGYSSKRDIDEAEYFELLARDIEDYYNALYYDF